MFNLGYCPGGDKRVVTRTSTTMAAMRTCPHLIQSEGYLSIIMYPGHPEGQDEASTLKEWIQTQDDFSIVENMETSNSGPQLDLASKEIVI